MTHPVLAKYPFMKKIGRTFSTKSLVEKEWTGMLSAIPYTSDWAEKKLELKEPVPYDLWLLDLHGNHVGARAIARAGYTKNPGWSTLKPRTWFRVPFAGQTVGSALNEFNDPNVVRFLWEITYEWDFIDGAFERKIWNRQTLHVLPPDTTIISRFGEKLKTFK